MLFGANPFRISYCHMWHTLHSLIQKRAQGGKHVTWYLDHTHREFHTGQGDIVQGQTCITTLRQVRQVEAKALAPATS